MRINLGADICSIFQDTNFSETKVQGVLMDNTKEMTKYRFLEEIL